MYTQTKKVVGKIIKTISLGMVKVANGSASANYTYQPKEPKGLKEKLEKCK